MMLQKILPPRKDFKSRPEEGTKMQNKLIKLFTHVNTEIKGVAADFLFVLCKENGKLYIIQLYSELFLFCNYMLF